MDTTLLIMAAGIGSRFGGGIKQLEPVDANGHWADVTDFQSSFKYYVVMLIGAFLEWDYIW